MADCLVVASKVKALVKPTRTSQEAIDFLSKFVGEALEEASKHAAEVKRKTVDLGAMKVGLRRVLGKV